MPRTAVPLHAADLSLFAKSVRRQLADRLATGAGLPGHVEMLNLLSRAAGHRNVQAARVAPQPMPARGPREPGLSEAADRALRQFDAAGRLARWPSRRAVQETMLWGLWLRFDGKRRYTEREVNELLNAWHTYGDHCTLRRELVEAKLLARTPGGAEYRKLPARPGGDVAAMLRVLRSRAA